MLLVDLTHTHTLLVSLRCGAESLGVLESLIVFDCPPVVPGGSDCVVVFFSVSCGGSRSCRLDACALEILCWHLCMLVWSFFIIIVSPWVGWHTHLVRSFLMVSLMFPSWACLVMEHFWQYHFEHFDVR